MQTITPEYTKELGTLPTEATLDHETRSLRCLYRYEDADVTNLLRELPRSRAWRPNTMFMFFDFADDPREGRFVNPLDVKPAFEQAPAVCKLDLEFQAMHVDELIGGLKVSPKQPLEHRLFVKAPVTIGSRRDWANWILCSAIDVFLQKGLAGRDKRLTAFVDDSMPTRALDDQEAIQIEKGHVKLSHGLWGHRRENLFERFFGPVAKAFESPLMATAGLPALVPTTISFLNRMIGEYTRESDLKDLWQTKSLDFRIARDADGVFTLRPGHWVVIDSDYVKTHPDLEGHKVDFEYETFEILDKTDKPIDAAYLVTRIQLEPQPVVH